MAKKNQINHRLDDAARAGWLYYVADKTQDEIAASMGISRQSAQRLVSLAVSEKLIKMSMDHPIAQCLELEQKLKDKYQLSWVEIVPNDTAMPSSTTGIAQAGATHIEQWLKKSDPIVMGMGTGRTLKAAVDRLPAMDCQQHRIVSLTGNISPDGSASFYNVIFTMADIVKAVHYPMPLPVLVQSAAERDLFHKQQIIASNLKLAASADVTFLGVGHMADDAPLLTDGFITQKELVHLKKQGAVGELCGWIYDKNGELINGQLNDRVASAHLPCIKDSQVIAIANGANKHESIKAAIKGRLINALISDEATAIALLK